MWAEPAFIVMCIYVCSVTSEEYELLLRLNQMTMAKYSDMTSLATRLNTVSDRLNEKCKEWTHPHVHGGGAHCKFGICSEE